MSGIAGIIHFDGKPVEPGLIEKMVRTMADRGPDGTGLWANRLVGLGHTLLATTPELVFERQPARHAESGCVVTADVRLDNRSELLRTLGLYDRAAVTGDAGLILAAYLTWGQGCVERFLGDFAFAIWDPCKQSLFCARDHFGMRPLYYHHSPGCFFAFASEPRAILVLPQTPCRINEGRIADFLVSQLEGINKTSTFFAEVYRLPPAHVLAATPERVRLERYWTLEAGSELRLPSNEAYAEAFLEVFTEAVRCRLRGAGPVGSMLSGGMDSGSVVAVAREILTKTGQGPLSTFSAVGPDPENCVETRTIHAALTMNGLDPHWVSHDRLDALLPELEELTWNLEEPFDNHMTLPRAVYLAARRRGLKVLLDGVAGDVVLGEGSHLARLLRRGRWLTAYHEAVGQNRFWGEHYPAWRALYHGARTAFTPQPVRRLWRRLRQLNYRKSVEANIRISLINQEFAHRVGLADRLRQLDGPCPRQSLSYGEERALSIDHPYLTVGRERYDRVAAAVGMEPRDPFLDRRVVAFCLMLPGEQKLGGGWPKIILRRAMAERLPDAVRWRRGKEHLGWAFTTALMSRMRPRIRGEIEANWELVKPYVDVDGAKKVCTAYFDEGDLGQADKVYEIAHLALWLRRHAERPRVAKCKINSPQLFSY